MKSGEFEDFGNELARGLRALGEASRDERPPARLEAALLTQFRRNRGAASPAWGRWAAAAAAVAIVSLAGLLLGTRPAPAPEPRPEITTGFFPLDGDASPSFEGVAVIRMTLPRRVLVNFGLPMNPDRAAEPVKADVAIGPDGTARAVRFVM
jgi:hypothetical protein